MKSGGKSTYCTRKIWEEIFLSQNKRNVHILWFFCMIVQLLIIVLRKSYYTRRYYCIILLSYFTNYGLPLRWIQINLFFIRQSQWEETDVDLQWNLNNDDSFINSVTLSISTYVVWCNRWLIYLFVEFTWLMSTYNLPHTCTYRPYR